MNLSARRDYTWEGSTINRPKETPLSALDAITAAYRLFHWKPPSGVRHEVTLFPSKGKGSKRRGAVLVTLECCGLWSFVEVRRVPDDAMWRGLETEAMKLKEAAWEIMPGEAVPSGLPFDADAIPRG